MAYPTSALSFPMRLRRHARPIAANEAPQRFGVLCIRCRHQTEQHGEGDRHVACRRLTGMNMPDGIRKALLGVLTAVAIEKLIVVVNVARNDVEVQSLRGLRFTIHEQRQALGAGVAQPLVDGEAVTFRLGNLLALIVEKQFVVETFRRRAAERPADIAGKQLNRSNPCQPSHSRCPAPPSALPNPASIAACSARR